MKRTYRRLSLLLVCFAVTAFLPAHTEAQLTAAAGREHGTPTGASPSPIYEGFDIPAGQPLDGTSGATSSGWEGLWTRPNFVEGGSVAAGSLVRPPGTESFFPSPIGGSAFCSGLQANIRRSPANLAPAPSLWGSFLVDPEVGFSSGFAINFNTDFPCCGGGSTLGFGNSSDGQSHWTISNGSGIFNTGNVFTDGVEAVVFHLEFNVSGTVDRLRVWFDANPNTEPPSFTVDAQFGEFAPRLTVSFNSSNNFGGSTLAIDEIRVGAFEDVIVVPAALALTSAVSRKIHGGAAPFDVALTSTGTPAVEGRFSAGDHACVFEFTNAVVSGTAELVTGVGSIAGSPVFSGNTMTVNLNGVADAQRIAIRLSGVTDGVGQVLPSTSFSVDLLTGDTNGDRVVNAGDALQTRSRSGQPADAANFRNDVNLDGVVSSGDALMVRSRSGQSLP